MLREFFSPLNMLPFSASYRKKKLLNLFHKIGVPIFSLLQYTRRIIAIEVENHGNNFENVADFRYHQKKFEKYQVFREKKNWNNVWQANFSDTSLRFLISKNQVRFCQIKFNGGKIERKSPMPVVWIRHYLKIIAKNWITELKYYRIASFQFHISEKKNINEHCSRKRNKSKEM